MGMGRGPTLVMEGFVGSHIVKVLRVFPITMQLVSL